MALLTTTTTARFATITASAAVKQTMARKYSINSLQKPLRRQQQQNIRKSNNINMMQTKRRFISSSALTIEKTTDEGRFTSKPPKEKLQFGITLSDHMLTVEWNKEKGGWGDPKIAPTQNLSISPAASSLHYGLQCFEGMKAYRSLSNDNDDNDLLLFRPDLNMARLQNSMSRLSMPGSDFDSDELIKCIQELVRVDERWVPDGEGYSLYVRPTVVATHPFLGLAAPESLLLYVITSPVGPYYKTGFNPIRLTADTKYIRAWPGGTGDCKVGGKCGSHMVISCVVLLLQLSSIQIIKYIAIVIFSHHR
mmetsp:Transcript_29141/g.44055  ORF Transcript_29141/g.44055 Transcript_29141/m.44055 type:complete len:308 (+) Transcript_29141:314-1237(+)